MAQLWDEDVIYDPLTKQCTECGKEIVAGDSRYETPGMKGRFCHRFCRSVILDVAFKCVGC